MTRLDIPAGLKEKVLLDESVTSHFDVTYSGNVCINKANKFQKFLSENSNKKTFQFTFAGEDIYGELIDAYTQERGAFEVFMSKIRGESDGRFAIKIKLRVEK